MKNNKESKFSYFKNKIIVLVISFILILLLIFVRKDDNHLINDKRIILPNACILTSDEIYFEELEEGIVTSGQVTALPTKPVKPKPVKKYILRNYNYIEPTGTGNIDIVNIAKSQIGNVGGKIYWSWYGFKERVEWCGAFVSWSAKEAGIKENIIPKFAKANDGARWFINHSLFRNRNYTPRVGDLIFFDWDYDGTADHVGFVSSVQNQKVYTIEGNREDECKKKVYPTNSDYILGYGTPNY